MNNTARIYHFATIVGSVLSAIVFSGGPAFLAKHEEIQFPCGRVDALFCQSPNEVYIGVFLSFFPVALGSYLLAVLLMRMATKRSYWSWVPASILGTVIGVLVSMYRSGGNPFGDPGGTVPILVFTLIVALVLLPFMALPSIPAQLYPRFRRLSLP